MESGSTFAQSLLFLLTKIAFSTAWRTNQYEILNFYTEDLKVVCFWKIFLIQTELYIQPNDVRGVTKSLFYSQIVLQTIKVIFFSNILHHTKQMLDTFTNDMDWVCTKWYK